MTEPLNVVTYWECPPDKMTPPWILLSLTLMKEVLGDRFFLLTPKRIKALLGETLYTQAWQFNPLCFEMDQTHLNIVARSDAIRICYLEAFGGIWLDADMIVLGNFLSQLPSPADGAFYWYNEAFFGATPNHQILKNTKANLFAKTQYDWGEPGDIRREIAKCPSLVHFMDNQIINPGYRPEYRFETCEVMFDTELPIEAFLQNPNVKILKLYNTYFTRNTQNMPSVAEFLEGNTLLARLFLHKNPNKQAWIDKTTMLQQTLESGSDWR